jgi:LysR family transcriptional regulator, mexEF-oprN operon transcriptional activator
MMPIPNCHLDMNKTTKQNSDLARVDLNLLKAFAVLMSERHVGRAAARLNITQSAMSKRLARLRAMFNDDVFQRTGDGVAPTPKALEIEEPVLLGLRQFESVISAQRGFDPKTVSRVYRLASNDLFAAIFAPKLIASLATVAPEIKLSIRQMQRAEMVEALERGDVDFAVTVLPDTPGMLRRAELALDAFVCLVSDHHPRIGDQLTLDAFVLERHLLVSLAGDFHGAIDRLLEQRGLSRSIAMSQPYHTAAPAIIAGSELIVTLPRSVARLVKWPGVRMLPLPLPHPGFRDVLYWHRRNDRDPAYIWMKAQILEASTLLETS